MDIDVRDLSTIFKKNLRNMQSAKESFPLVMCRAYIFQARASSYFRPEINIIWHQVFYGATKFIIYKTETFAF
jgi:hypothetical protein